MHHQTWLDAYDQNRQTLVDAISQCPTDPPGDPEYAASVANLTRAQAMSFERGAKGSSFAPATYTFSPKGAKKTVQQAGRTYRQFAGRAVDSLNELAHGIQTVMVSDCETAQRDLEAAAVSYEEAEGIYRGAMAVFRGQL